MSNMLPPAIFLMGPTATGKTELAIELCQRRPCDIISVDSVMVYRGMDIGSAKPDAATLAAAPHRLIDICDPAEPFSAAQFRQRAIEEIKAILARGRIPLLVGGTMLYFHALERGLSALPSSDPAMRARLEAELNEFGLAHLHARLAEVDPEAAARIHANDPQRTLRALEVFGLTGASMSSLLRQEINNDLPCRPVKIVLTPIDRAALHQRIAQRFQAMLEQGLVEEVEALYRRGDLHVDLPSMRAVGYRQVWEYLAGHCDYDTLRERGVIATRQLAKRQLTWLKHQPEAAAFRLGFEEKRGQILAQVLKYLAASAI
ncbi:MAG: tRNA (adenosine(37)-N6)-dimethylallyltransferase MiaA [Gammaproteobacteria bacterium]|nr:tRNA (adenosine(37)-N6)-dimethylallyltransferase MiaA [Gammaproteobacteria bacterium]